MTAPTAAEIAEVDAGVNGHLVDAAFEPRDPDPVVAAMQDDRDRLAYRGDFERADDLNNQIVWSLQPQLAYDREPEVGS